LETEPFTGRILTGRVASGIAKAGLKVYALDQAGQIIEEGFITKVLSKIGLTRHLLEEGMSGDLLSIAGLSKATVNMTITSSPTDKPIPAPSIDPPVLSVSITVNDSPLAGKEGSNLNPAAITERLLKEATHNVSLTVQRSEIDKTLEVSGRGELHLGILIENLRREGFELNISQPRIIFKEENGQKLEPQEELVIDVEEQFSGLIMERMVARKAEMVDVRPYGGKLRIRYLCVSRALLGLKPILDNETRGSTQLHHSFHSYVPHKGSLSSASKGSIISMATGKTTAYALDSIQDRGILFVGPNTPVYEGMIIGENAKPGDLDVNPCKEKALTNVRAANKDESIKLAIPKVISLEEAICRIHDDELIEITPKSIRLRKKILSSRIRQTTGKKNK
jgi:GTP-binding protein